MLTDEQVAALRDDALRGALPVDLAPTIIALCAAVTKARAERDATDALNTSYAERWGEQYARAEAAEAERDALRARLDAAREAWAHFVPMAEIAIQPQATKADFDVLRAAQAQMDAALQNLGNAAPTPMGGDEVTGDGTGEALPPLDARAPRWAPPIQKWEPRPDEPGPRCWWCNADPQPPPQPPVAVLVRIHAASEEEAVREVESIPSWLEVTSCGLPRRFTTDGSRTVSVRRRDVTWDDYIRELAAWRPGANGGGA